MWCYDECAKFFLMQCTNYWLHYLVQSKKNQHNIDFLCLKCYKFYTFCNVSNVDILYHNKTYALSTYSSVSTCARAYYVIIYILVFMKRVAFECRLYCFFLSILFYGAILFYATILSKKKNSLKWTCKKTRQDILDVGWSAL